MEPELLRTALEHAADQGECFAHAERDAEAAEKEVERLQGELAMATAARGLERRLLACSVAANEDAAREIARLRKIEAKTKAKPKAKLVRKK